MSNSLVPVNPVNSAMSLRDIMELAKHVVDSKMYGWNNAAQVIVMMNLCVAKGLHPIEAVERYHCLNGKPSMKADSMLAEFQSKGGIVKWVEYEQDAVTGVFSHPQSPEPLSVRWTIRMAQEAGLLNKPGPWKQFPRAMLRARVISEAIRTVLPGVCIGIYTPEEVGDFTSVPVTATEQPQYDSLPAMDAEIVPESDRQPQPKEIESVPAPKVNPERDEFDRVAATFGIIFANGKERGDLAISLLNGDYDKNKGFSADDWKLAASCLYADQSQPETEAQPASIVDENYGFEDPFAKDDTEPSAGDN